VATVSNEVEEVRRRMAEIRRELHEDVREVVATAEAVTDWQRYVRTYPLASLGVAFALGYVVVPKRRRRIPADVATQSDVAKVREAVETKADEGKKEKASKGLIGMAWALLTPVAVRAAQSYAVQYLENWIHEQQQAAASTGPPRPERPAAPGGPGHARGPANF
jgi:hypothetical protein